MVSKFSFCPREKSLLRKLTKTAPVVKKLHDLCCCHASKQFQEKHLGFFQLPSRNKDKLTLINSALEHKQYVTRSQAQCLTLYSLTHCLRTHLLLALCSMQLSQLISTYERHTCQERKKVIMGIKIFLILSLYISNTLKFDSKLIHLQQALQTSSAHRRAQLTISEA